jgi:predicted  nucleic acid-binding Zn-ribbon protein
MSVTAAALRELHRIHQQLAELRDRLERGPKQVRAREANVKQLEVRLTEARDRAKQTQIALDRKQLDLRSGEQKVIDLRVKLNAANSNREYQALLEQIAAAEMAGSVLSDEILEGLEKIDQLGAATKEAEKNLGAGKQEMEKARHAVESSAATIRSDVARLEGELAEAEKALPADLKADYQRVVRS